MLHRAGDCLQRSVELSIVNLSTLAFHHTFVSVCISACARGLFDSHVAYMYESEPYDFVCKLARFMLARVSFLTPPPVIYFVTGIDKKKRAARLDCERVVS